MATLRTLLDGVNTDDGSSNLRAEQDVANGMGELRKAWNSGRLTTEINPLRTDELDAQIAGDTAGAQRLRQQIDGLSQRQQMYAPRVGRVEQVKGVGDALDWVQGAVGQGVASMADPMAISAGLNTVGRLTSMVPHPMARGVGYAAQGAGMLIPAMMSKNQLTGEFIGEAGRDKELMARTSPAALRDMAGNYGTIAAIPDSFLPGMVGRQISGLSRASGAVARKSAMGAGVKTLGVMGMEGTTETMQGAGSQYAQGLLNPDRDTSGDFMDNVNNFAGGAIGSGPIAAAGAYSEGGHNRLGAGVDRVTDAAGSVVDMADRALNTAENREILGNVKETAVKAKDNVIDMFRDEDGEVNVKGVIAKGSEHIKRWGRSDDELNIIAGESLPAGLEGAKAEAWFVKSDQKRDALISDMLAGLADDPAAQALSERLATAPPAERLNVLEEAGEFLIERHEQTQSATDAGKRTNRLARAAGRLAASAAKGVFGLVKDAAAGAKEGFGKKNMQQESDASPYEDWVSRTGRSGLTLGEEAISELNSRMGPDAPGSNPTNANSGPSNWARDQSRRRAEIFGDKMAAAAKRANDGDQSIASFMRDTGFEIADLAEKWGLGGGAKPDAAKYTPGLLLALTEIANDTRVNMGDLALEVINSMKRMSDPRSAPMFEQITTLIASGNTKEGRAARAQLRTTAADSLLQLIDENHYKEFTSGKIDPDTKAEITPATLLKYVEEVSRGGYDKQVRVALEKHYGRDTWSKMLAIVNDLDTETTQERETSEVDALAEKEGLKAMDKSRENDIFGFGGNLNLRSKKDGKDVFAHTSTITTADRANGITSRRPQLFRTSTDAKGNVVGSDMWDKAHQSGENKLQAQIDLMKSRVGHIDEDNTNGWGVEARSAQEILDDQRATPQKRLELYRDYLSQDASNEDYTAAERAAATKKAMSVGALIAEIRQRQSKPAKPQSEWKNEDTAAWQKQLQRATAKGYKGEDTSHAALDEFEIARMLPDAKDYFSNHHVVVARNQQDRNEQKLGADTVMKMKVEGKKVASKVKLDASVARIDGGAPAADQVVSDANLLMFPVQKFDKKGKPMVDEQGNPVSEDVPIRASDLVLWARTVNSSDGHTQKKGEETGSPAVLNRRYLTDLMAGVQAFAADGHALGLPYKMNGGGEKEYFGDGIPGSLRLDNAVYAEALNQVGFRLTNKSKLGLQEQLDQEEEGITYAGRDARAGRLNQQDVAKDQDRNDDFFTVEDREERDPVFDERTGRAKDAGPQLVTRRDRRVEDHEEELMQDERWKGPAKPELARVDKDRPRVRADISGQIASEPKGEGAPLDYTKGQDPKAEYDENSELAYRTDVMNEKFKAPTNALKGMSSAKHNAEALTAMMLNDPREGDRMAITMLRAALAPKGDNRGKAFDSYRIAPLVQLISEDQAEGSNKTRAELFEQRGATPDLVNILRRGSMQVLLREMKAREPTMTEAHILKLARMLPGLENVTAFNVAPQMREQLIKAGGEVSPEDMATNWSDPSQRKTQPKMSAPPVNAAPKQTIAQRVAERKEKASEPWVSDLTDDEINGIRAAPTTGTRPKEVNRVQDEEAIRQARNRMRDSGVMPGAAEGKYAAKDRAKADKANKFIGRGSQASSTNRYMEEWGDRANTGVYTKDDVVFISAEGDRAGRITPDTQEIKRATSAGATIITDVKADRERAYNIGERRVAYILVDAGYSESSPGTWTPGNTKPAPGVAGSQVGKPQSGGVKRNNMAAATGQAVADSRSIMRSLGFKSAPERFADVAAKLLTDPDHDLGGFIKDSAKALSHVLTSGENLSKVRDALRTDAWFAERARITARLTKGGMMRGDAMVESYRVITEMALIGELAARTKAEKTALGKLVQMIKELVSKFKDMTGSAEFSDLVRNMLNDTVAKAQGPQKLKEGHKKVSFQEAVDADPTSAAVLAHMSKNPNISLTGSIVLANNGTIYRNATNMLHDLDLIVQGTKEAAEKHLRAAFPDAVQVYDFKTSNGKVDTFIVPPKGSTVTDITREGNVEGKGKITGFKVMKDGKEIGRTWNDASGEQKSGVTGTLVDFFTGTNKRPVSKIAFTVGGQQHHINAMGAASIFDAKLSMHREKDINDYVGFISNVGRKLNAMSVAIHTDLERDGFAATHDSPIRHEGKFDWRAHQGKGEGNASFGAGTYLSTADGVHESYKGQFTEEVAKHRTLEWDGVEYSVDEEYSVDGEYNEVSQHSGSAAKDAVIYHILIDGMEAVEALAAAKESVYTLADRSARDIIDNLDVSADALGVHPDAVTNLTRKMLKRERLTADDVGQFSSLIRVEQWNKIVSRAEKLAGELKTIDVSGVRASPLGASPTYQVSVDIKPEQLLDWNAPLNEQSAAVKKALGSATEWKKQRAWNGDTVHQLVLGNKLLGDFKDAADTRSGKFEVGSSQYGEKFDTLAQAQAAVAAQALDSSNTNGQVLYAGLTNKLGSQAKASDYLQSLGILGHRFNSSGGKNNTHPNYVIYDDSKITTNYIHFNKQAGKPGAHESWKSGPTSQDEQQKEMDAAKAWLEKVLPGTVLKFIDETGWSGEYVEAENLINISKTAAAGIMGTAYHEGLHKFFAQLVRGNPKLMAVMRDFVNDPKVLARLEELLVDYPAARDQLADGEERLAYAFQFWKAGLLAVDTKPANIFQKIGALMRRILGTMRNSEHVNAIFSAFDEGLMSEPSAAGKVIAKQLAKGTNNLVVRRKLDKLVQGLAAGVLPAEMILGNSVSASARKIGALMFTNPGDGVSGGTVGYINAKRNTSRTFDNRAKQMFESMNKVDMDAVQEFMQSETPLKDIKAQSHRDAVEGLRNLMDEFHKYMTDSGLKVGKIDNYYPTVWSLAQLHAKKSEFLKMLVNNYAEQMNPDGGNAHKAALRIWQSLVDRDGIDDLRLESKRLDAAEGKPVREDGVLSPFFAGQESRTLPWLEGQHKAAFLEKNMVGTLSAYFHQGVRATEYRRRFGENGVKLEVMLKSARSELDGASREMLAREEFKDDEARKKWVTRQMRDVSMSVGAIEGTLGKDISPNMRKFNSWMTVYQNVRLLPMALFSSFVDPLAMVARGAPMAAAFETFVHGVQSVFRAWGDSFKDLPPDRVKGKWADLAEHIGATEVAAFTHHVAEEYSSAYMSPAAKKINDFMFRFNGMEAWDRSNRIMATKWAVRFIEQHAALPDKNHSARWLAELGLTKDSVPLNADGELIVDKHELAASKGITVEQAAKEMAVVHAALNRWVEGAVITPNAAQRPAWSSDPNYSIFFHLKQFSYSFQQTVMKRAVNEIEHGNIAPIGALAMFIPTMIASDILKGLIQGGGSLPPYMAGFTAGDWALHGLNRSGLAGVGDIGMNAAMDPMSLAGPGVEQLTDAMRQPFDRTLMKAAPAHALYEYMMPATASGG